MGKDLIVAILTTLVGSILLSFLIFIGKSHPVLSSFLVLVLVAAIVAIINYQGRLILMLKSARNYNVSGDWRTTWSYTKPDGRVDIAVTLKLKQIGQYIRGTGRSIKISGPAPFDALEYEMEGRIQPDGIIQGEWKNLNVGMNYYGTFQAKVARHGKKVDGVWVGFDSDTVRHGTYYSEKT